MSAYKIRQIIQQSRRRHSVRQPGFIITLKKGLFFSGILFSVLLAAGVLYSLIIYQQITSDLPPINYLEKALDPQDGLFLEPSRIYDRSGTHILFSFEMQGEKRKFLPIDPTQAESISSDYTRAVVAYYEPGFWEDKGVDWVNLFNPQPNTITEKLVNDILLPYDSVDITHAIRMKILAYQIGQNYTKNQVLEWFINSRYFGHYTFGVENAARLYLGKSATNITFGESAFMLAIAEAPALNPIDSPASALEGRKTIISQWVKNGALPATAAVTLANEDIKLAISAHSTGPRQTAFVNLAIQQAEKSIPPILLARGGMKIYSTLDWDLQTQMACTLHKQLLALKITENPSDEKDGSCQAGALLPVLPSSVSYPETLSSSAIMIDLQQGEVLALVGDSDLNGDGGRMKLHNPGTLLTPFVSLAAFQRGYSPASLVWDIPSKLPAGLPDAYIKNITYQGPIRFRTAVNHDNLTPLFSLLDQLGAANVWKISEPLGLHLSGSTAAPLDYLLNGSKASIYTIARAYSTIANQGEAIGQMNSDKSISPNAILKIEDAYGEIKTDYSSPQKQLIVNPPLTYLVNHILSDESSRQDSSWNLNGVDIGRPAAIKLGQTGDKKDSWTVGYTPQQLAAVWVGAVDNNSSVQLDARVSSSIWSALMRYSSQIIPVQDWPVPDTIQIIDVCDPSGDLPTEYCPLVVKEVFVSGNEPSTRDSLYRQYYINRETGKLATIFTPVDLVERKVYMVAPSDEALSWFKSSGIATPPDSYDDILMPAIQPDVNIEEPAIFNTVHGAIAIKGTADGSQFTGYHLDVGKGLNPDAWQQIGSDGTQPVNHGILGTWETTRFENGLYVLRLTVENNDQSIKTAVTQVMIENNHP